MVKQPDYRELVHSPAELAHEHVQWARRLNNTPGVPFGIPVIDEHVIPLHPGDMAVFVARPGHAKTAMLAYLARAEAKRIQERKTVDTEAVVYVTWEQVTEEINGVLDVTDAYTVNDLARGKADIAKVEEHSTKRAGLPIWIIGDSLARTNAKSPRMYPETVFQAIESMADDYGVRPTLLCFDYIQLVPIPRQGDRQKQVIEAAHGCKELAKRAGAPAAVAVQARREVDERNVKIPGLWDAQWSSSIEQAADKYFGLWRPWQTERHKDASGGPMYVDGGNGTRYEVKPTLLFMTMHKQRFGDGAHSWGLYFHPGYLKLMEIERDIEEPINF